MTDGEQVVRVVARTLDEARRRAARQLQVGPSLLDVEVVGARRSGLLGLGAPKLEVLVWVREAGPERRPAAARTAAPPVTAASPWSVTCRGGECFLNVSQPGPWLHAVEERLLDWPLDEYDRDAVRRAISGLERSPVRIGLIRPADPADADRPCFVKLGEDAMSSWIVPGRGGPPDRADLDGALTGAGVRWGIDRAAVEAACGRELSEPVRVALGSEPAASRDASIEYLFSEEEELAALRPRVREDGTVDYRDLNPMYTVQPGTVVGRYLPAVNGEPGRDVLGRERAAVPPASDTPPEWFAGRNVALAPNGVDLVAAAAGRPVRHGARIEIVEIYAINGDVDYSTGNVDFNGEVYITGDVQPGFTVRATGNVRIDGIVDAANVEAGQDVLISGGVHGHGESRIVCGGEMSARFIESAEVDCDGSLLVISTIVRSRVTCGGKVTVIGRGSIIGGKVTAVAGITCNSAGSAAGVPTSLELNWLGAVQPGPNRDRDLARLRAASIIIHRDLFPGTVVTINGAKFPVRDQLWGVSFQAADRGIALYSARDRRLAGRGRRRWR